MPFLEANGVPHFYEWIRSESASNTKPVMVFVHGWAGSGRYWRGVAEVLKGRFDCFIYDLRGFGRSRIPSPQKQVQVDRGYALQTFADDLAALLDALGIQRVYLNAHSMGASIAVFFANAYPNRLEKLILTCNGVFEYDQKAFEAFYRFGGYVVAFRPSWLRKIPLLPGFFMARFLHRPIPLSEKIAFLEDFLEADYDTALGTIFTSVSKQATEVMPQEFSRLSMPTLLISGEYDQITPAELGRKASVLNDLIDYVLIPNTSHFPMLEDPDLYLTQLMQFLQTVESAGNR